MNTTKSSTQKLSKRRLSLLLHLVRAMREVMLSAYKGSNVDTSERIESSSRWTERASSEGLGR